MDCSLPHIPLLKIPGHWYFQIPGEYPFKSSWCWFCTSWQQDGYNFEGGGRDSVCWHHGYYVGIHSRRCWHHGECSSNVYSRWGKRGQVRVSHIKKIKLAYCMEFLPKVSLLIVVSLVHIKFHPQFVCTIASPKISKLTMVDSPMVRQPLTWPTTRWAAITSTAVNIPVINRKVVDMSKGWTHGEHSHKCLIKSGVDASILFVHVNDNEDKKPAAMDKKTYTKLTLSKRCIQRQRNWLQETQLCCLQRFGLLFSIGLMRPTIECVTADKNIKFWSLCERVIRSCDLGMPYLQFRTHHSTSWWQTPKGLFYTVPRASDISCYTLYVIIVLLACLTKVRC